MAIPTEIPRPRPTTAKATCPTQRRGGMLGFGLGRILSVCSKKVLGESSGRLFRDRDGRLCAAAEVLLERVAE